MQISSTPDFPSKADLEDADEILFIHSPRQVARYVCACDEDFPCFHVKFARLVKAAAAAHQDPDRNDPDHGDGPGRRGHRP